MTALNPIVTNKIVNIRANGFISAFVVILPDDDYAIKVHLELGYTFYYRYSKYLIMICRSCSKDYAITDVTIMYDKVKLE